MHRGVHLLGGRAGSAFPLSLCPSSAPLAYPVVSSRGALPVRPERHVPDPHQLLLLPPSLQERLPDVHLAFFMVLPVKPG